MAKEEENDQFVAIRSMFLSGSVRRMKDIEKLYPTAMAKTLRINHSRYIHKLYHPEGFTFKQLVTMANILELDIQIIIDVIIRQLSTILKIGRKKAT